MTPSSDGFFGSDLTGEQADQIAIARIPSKVLALEPELMRSKWFDYRLMHPTVATYAFVKEYSRAYSRYIATTQDVERAPFVKGFKGQDFAESRECKTFWLLRQTADKLGIRYDFFCQWAVNFCIAGGWRQPPRPSHIYTNEEMLAWILEHWLDECEARLQFTKHSHYMVENFTGTEQQLAYEQWLMEQIGKRQRRKYSLHAAIYVEGRLRVEAAIERFGADLVNESADYALLDFNQPS